LRYTLTYDQESTDDSGNGTAFPTHKVDQVGHDEMETESEQETNRSTLGTDVRIGAYSADTRSMNEPPAATRWGSMTLAFRGAADR